jgi:hypothetical protein
MGTIVVNWPNLPAEVPIFSHLSSRSRNSKYSGDKLAATLLIGSELVMAVWRIPDLAWHRHC